MLYLTAWVNGWVALKCWTAASRISASVLPAKGDPRRKYSCFMVSSSRVRLLRYLGTQSGARAGYKEGRTLAAAGMNCSDVPHLQARGHFSFMVGVTPAPT